MLVVSDDDAAVEDAALGGEPHPFQSFIARPNNPSSEVACALDSFSADFSSTEDRRASKPPRIPNAMTIAGGGDMVDNA